MHVHIPNVPNHVYSTAGWSCDAMWETNTSSCGPSAGHQHHCCTHWSQCWSSTPLLHTLVPVLGINTIVAHIGPSAGHQHHCWTHWSQCWASTPLLDTLALIPGALLGIVVGELPCSQVKSYIPGKWMAWCSEPASHPQIISTFLQPSFLQMKLNRP